MNRCRSANRPEAVLRHPAQPCTMRTNLLVIGASARCFAGSAARAGWEVAAIDLFGDRDLSRVCRQVIRLSPAEYPMAIPIRARRLPPGPAVYGGGLENHPQVLARLAADRPLVGNKPADLATVRQPADLAALAADAGWLFPETFCDPAGLPADGSFLRKPTASAGGQGIVRWTAEQLPLPASCWQRFVAGPPFSASLLMLPGRTELLGVCRQFVGLTWCHGPRFGCCGGVELPLPGPDDPLVRPLQRLLETLTSHGRLMGLVGVDFIVQQMAGRSALRPVLIEINPRPTATMELIERRTGVNLAAAHLAACGWSSPRPPTVATAGRGVWAKAILFASAPVTITAELDRRLSSEAIRTRSSLETGWPLLADCPVIGDQIEAGSPILTVFAAAVTPAAAVLRLRRRVRALEPLLGLAAASDDRTQPASRRGSSDSSGRARNCIK